MEMSGTDEFSCGTVRLLISPSVGRQNFDKGAQPLLLLPQDAKRQVREGFAT